MTSEEGPVATAINHDGSPPEEKWRPNHAERKPRFPRACTSRPSAASRLYSAPAAVENHRRPASSPSATARREKEQQQCSKLVTPLVEPPSTAQLPRWSLRSMWELASLLHFLHVFWPLLNITVEFSAEELETALITPNSTLDDIHIPLLRAIPPVARMALGPATWITVLCRKLKDWWHWVADGEIPIVASHGTEIETYKTLDPATRVLILKALCDIRVEQEDIRSYIDNSIKHGVQLSAFRRERIGGDSHGISYWYEDDPVIGYRLYREIRRVEFKKIKTKGVPSLPNVSCQWETVATNFDEFQEVCDKLFSSKNRTEAVLGKRLKIDILPEVEKAHKRKERLLKKQHRQAILLDSFLSADGLPLGRSLRDRKPVTYTFDDFDRSINEAIKITKRRQASPEQHAVRRENVNKPEASANGIWNGPSQPPQHVSYEVPSPKSNEYEDTDVEQKSGTLDRCNRRRKRPERYSEKEFVEAVSDNEADFYSDDDIMGEAVYDEEYLRSRRQKKVSSSSEGDEEYHWEEENLEEDEEEEVDGLSVSDESDEPDRYKKARTRSRRETKLRSVDELQTGLRRSKRSTRPRVNYRQYELSDSDADSTKPGKSNASDGRSDASNDLELSVPSQDSQDDDDDRKVITDHISNQDRKEITEHIPNQDRKEITDHISNQDRKEITDQIPNQDRKEITDQIPKQDHVKTVEEQTQSVAKTSSPGQEGEGVRIRRFLDLNELAPSTGFDDGPNTTMKSENEDDL